MTSLYNRATPRQAAVLRIVEGAVHNAAHAHPEYQDHRQIRPLNCQAGSRDTDGCVAVCVGAGKSASDRRGPHSQKAAEVRTMVSPDQVAGKLEPRVDRAAVALTTGRSPVRLLFDRVSKLALKARFAGDADKLAAYIEVLRMIDEVGK